MSAEIVDTVNMVAAAVQSVGVLTGGSWALYAYFSDRRRERLANFRKILVSYTQRFEELARSYQWYIVAIVREVFDMNDPEYKTLLDIIKEALAKPDRESTVKFLDANELYIQQRVLFSMGEDTGRFIYNVVNEFESALAPVQQHSKVAHLFMRDCTHVVAKGYKNFLDLENVTSSIKLAILVLWEATHTTDLKIEDDDDLTIRIRDFSGSAIDYYRNGVSSHIVFSELLDVARSFVDAYRNSSDAVLWKYMRQDKRANVERLDKESYVDTFRAVVRWKKLPNSDECLHEIDELEAVLSPPEPEEDEQPEDDDQQDESAYIIDENVVDHTTSEDIATPVPASPVAEKETSPRT